VLMLAPFETRLLKDLKDLPITERQYSSPTLAAQSAVDQVMARVRNNKDLLLRAQQAYQAWLGFYNSSLKVLRWDKATLVQYANQFAFICGLPEVPGLMKRTIGKVCTRCLHRRTPQSRSCWASALYR
jgi:ATP-dependent RNA helicase MSS116, mitochondrial